MMLLPPFIRPFRVSAPLSLILFINPWLQFYSAKTRILTFLSMLSISHPEAHLILNASLHLIPSIVVYLTSLVGPVFDEDERLMRRERGEVRA
jgi:hypothetical protein